VNSTLQEVKTSLDCISETISHSPDHVCLDEAITCSESSPDNLYEAAKQNMEQIQFSLQKIQYCEKEIVSMSAKPDLDIDDLYSTSSWLKS
jgi:hypothetical protein